MLCRALGEKIFRSLPPRPPARSPHARKLRRKILFYCLFFCQTKLKKYQNKLILKAIFNLCFKEEKEDRARGLAPRPPARSPQLRKLRRKILFYFLFLGQTKIKQIEINLSPNRFLTYISKNKIEDRARERDGRKRKTPDGSWRNRNQTPYREA